MKNPSSQRSAIQEGYDRIVEAHWTVSTQLRILARAQTKREAIPALSQVFSVLAEHYAVESEPGGFFDLFIRPTHGQAMVNDLTEAHHILTAATRGLIARNREISFLSGCHLLAEQLIAHEELEARLAAEASDANTYLLGDER